MQTPNDEAGRITEEIMALWKNRLSARRLDVAVAVYNACYSACYDVLKWREEDLARNDAPVELLMEKFDTLVSQIRERFRYK